MHIQREDKDIFKERKKERENERQSDRERKNTHSEIKNKGKSEETLNFCEEVKVKRGKNRRVCVCVSGRETALAQNAKWER